MSKPSKVAKYLAEAERLTALIDTYRAAKAGLERSPAPTKLKQLPALDRPTEIPGFPLGPNRPGPEIPSYGSRGVGTYVSHRIKRRASGMAILDPIGPGELRKRESVREPAGDHRAGRRCQSD
jgi:hypothetical protein